VAKLTTKYQYDNVGNLTIVDYSGGAAPPTPSVTNAYDALNRLTNMVDGVGVTKYTYTSGGFLYTEDGPFASDTVTNLYFDRLRVGLGLQQPTGAWTNGFGYDAAKRLTSVTSPAGAFGYTYDAMRLRLPIKVSLPNSSYITNVYDVNARLLSTTLNNSSGTALDAAMYGYNTANQRTTFTNAAGANVSYSYDPIGQLKVATSSLSPENRGYAYDAAWNVSNRTNNGANTTFIVDGKNQLTSVGSTTFAYDSNGNLSSKTITVGFHTTNTIYTYDAENRLVGVEVDASVPASSNLTTFVYDGLSRLREQLQWTSSGGGSLGPLDSGGGGSWNLIGGTLYVYDGKRVIQERDTNNTPAVVYTRGNDLSGSLAGAGGIGGHLARSSGYSGSTGNWSTHDYYHADGNGNITCLVDTSQTLAASYRYDPYGNLISSSGALAGTNTCRFSSKEYIPSAGLYYYLYRFYDPNLQRWVNRDPLGDQGFLTQLPHSHPARAPREAEAKPKLGRAHSSEKDAVSRARRSEVPDAIGSNPYMFVFNSPCAATDPEGLISFWFGVCIGKLSQVEDPTDDQCGKCPQGTVTYSVWYTCSYIIQIGVVTGPPGFGSFTTQCAPGSGNPFPVVRFEYGFDWN
jgi:RHS repeat-associated protein